MSPSKPLKVRAKLPDLLDVAHYCAATSDVLHLGQAHRFLSCQLRDNRWKSFYPLRHEGLRTDLACMLFKRDVERFSRIGVGRPPVIDYIHRLQVFQLGGVARADELLSGFIDVLNGKLWLRVAHSMGVRADGCCHAISC